MRVVAIGLFLLLGSGAALADRLGQGPDDDISAWRIVVSFLVCVVLAVGGAFFLKARMGGTNQLLRLMPKPNRRLQLVESLRLSPRAGLSIVDCDGSEMLVSISDTGVHLIGKLPLPQAGSGE